MKSKRYQSKRKGKYKSILEYDVGKSVKKVEDIDVQYEASRLIYFIEGTYIPDFTITLSNNHKVYIEAKGYFRPEDKRKMSAVIACNPSLDIRMIFSRKVKSNIKWCEKRKVPWAIGSIPKEWLEV